jgi:hypothetical protein
MIIQIDTENKTIYIEDPTSKEKIDQELSSLLVDIEGKNYEIDYYNEDGIVENLTPEEKKSCYTRYILQNFDKIVGISNGTPFLDNWDKFFSNK